EEQGQNSFRIRIRQQTTDKFKKNNEQLKENNNEENEKFRINRYQYEPAYTRQKYSNAGCSKSEIMGKPSKEKIAAFTATMQRNIEGILKNNSRINNEKKLNNTDSQSKPL
ncbi:32632_t:CDS:2, partial [Racocetra persica]